jgi:hypothetical protein
VHSVVFFIPKIYKAIISRPIIRMNNTIRVHLASYNGLQSGFSTVWDYFCIYFTSTLKNTKNNLFPRCSTSSFSFYAMSSEIGFINFYFTLKRRFIFTKLGNPSSNQIQITVNCVTI